MRESPTLQRRPHLQQRRLGRTLAEGWQSPENKATNPKRAETYCVLPLLSCQVQVCNFQRQFFGIDVGAVGQHDDGQLVVREALDGGTETDRAAVMRHAFVTLIGIEKPAEAIAYG